MSETASDDPRPGASDNEPENGSMSGDQPGQESKADSAPVEMMSFRVYAHLHGGKREEPLMNALRVKLGLRKNELDKKHDLSALEAAHAELLGG